MRAITYSHARANLAKTIQTVCDNHEPIIITRKNKNAVVMLSLHDYESINETSYLMQSPKNAKRLMDSIQELEQDKGTERELIQ